MPRRAINYREGDIIAVPLADASWGLGIIARTDGKGGLIGYFFAPKCAPLPVSAKAFSKKPAEAVLIVHCGDLGLLDGRWKVIGQAQNWDRRAWPIPAFARTDAISGLNRKVIYSEESLTTEVTTLHCSPEDAHALP